MYMQIQLSFHFAVKSHPSSSAPAVLRHSAAVSLADSTVSELCPLCGLTLGSELCFNLHINQDTSTGYVTYECRICKYNDARKRRMRDHLRVHTGEKPFSCPHCPYRASQTSSLQSHIKRYRNGEANTCTHSVVIGCRTIVTKSTKQHIPGKTTTSN